jgi:hypothetical protein
MTPPPDDRDEPPQGRPDGPDVPLDEEAAWRLIVENYGERPEMGEETPPAPPPGPAEPADRPDPPVIDRSYLESVEADRAEAARAAHRADDDAEHFVPPDPPPVPRATPARRLAWAGLFLPPVLMLLAVAFGWEFAPWFSMMLVASFVGGFVFLIATMPRDGGDGWDDGAVV